MNRSDSLQKPFGNKERIARGKGGMFLKSVRDKRLCTECGFCKTVAACPLPSDCISCLACFRGCPSQAVRTVTDEIPGRMISLSVDNLTVQMPERTTLKKALGHVGVTF